MNIDITLNDVMMMTMISPSDLLGLRVLAAVVQEGSVQGAADRLAVTQSAVSNALAKLRVRAGDPLLVRVGNRHQPTFRARRLAEKTAPFLDEAETLLHARDAFDPAALSRRFVIGMPDYLEQLIAPSLFRRLIAAAPKMTLAFRRASAESVHRLIDSGEIDLAVSRMEQPPPWQRGTVVVRERFVVIHAKGARPSAEAISLDAFAGAKHAMVSFTTRGEGQIDDALRKLGRSREVVVAVSSFAILADIVKGSELIASVPHPVAYRLGRTHDLACAEFGFSVPPIDVTMLHAEIHSSDPALQWLMQKVEETIDATKAFA